MSPTSDREPTPLGRAIETTTRRALATGALEPIATETRALTEGGIPFVLRVVTSIARKSRSAGLPRPAGYDPFLPWDDELFVAELTPTHVALLNKYPVVEHHVLAVTRVFEEQDALLGSADWEALLVVLADLDGLGFYNSGARAGASQQHKHLQVIPLPFAPGVTAPPIEPVLLDDLAGHGISRSPRLPFVHAACRLAPSDRTSDGARRRYLALLDELGLRRSSSDARPQPYNLLVTRRWMLVAPRSAESCDGISVNALGFAGGLFAKDAADAARIEARGPLSLLSAVGFPAQR